MAPDTLRGHAGFRFTRANGYNKVYNPAGPVSASGYQLPYADGTFKMALLKSVFTHIMPEHVRALREGGKPGDGARRPCRAVITCFLLNDEARALIGRDRDEVKMPTGWQGDPLRRVANPGVPKIATAHDEARIRRIRRRPGSRSTRSRLAAGAGVRAGSHCRTP